MRHAVTWVPLALALLGCERPQADGPVPLTYYGQIRPILEAECVGCHVDGEIAPFALDNPDDALTHAAASVASVEDGRMPPWQPSPDCRSYEGERIMSAAHKDALRAWLDAGAPLGEPADAADLPQVRGQALSQGLEGANVITGMAEPYTPVRSADYPDDYRCFLLDAQFDEDTYILDERVFPDARLIVHHVLIYLVPPSTLADVQARDDADEGPGYECFSGPGVAQDSPIGAWVPGYQAPSRSGLAGFHVPAGSRLVMQMHYSTLSNPPSPDRTRFELVTTTTPPEFLLSVRPFPHLEMAVPAGEADSVQIKRFKNDEGEPWIIAGVAPHMHLLGSRIRVDALHPDGERECLAEIPDWDFNWQQSYMFTEASVLDTGGEIELICHYDNSAENQPTVNGERIAPRDVRWGEQTLDEMCLAFLVTVRES